MATRNSVLRTRIVMGLTDARRMGSSLLRLLTRARTLPLPLALVHRYHSTTRK